MRLPTARCCKSDCLGPRLPILQAINYKCGIMPVAEKTTHRTSLKICLNSFQIKVILPPNSGPGLLSSFGEKVKNKKLN